MKNLANAFYTEIQLKLVVKASQIVLLHIANYNLIQINIEQPLEHALL